MLPWRCCFPLTNRTHPLASHPPQPHPSLLPRSEFVSPSPIQSQVWPIILAGHDLIGIAATGSGEGQEKAMCDAGAEGRGGEGSSPHRHGRHGQR